MENNERNKTLTAKVSGQAERIRKLESRIRSLGESLLETRRHISLTEPSGIVKKERSISKKLDTISDTVGRFERRLTLCTEVVFFINNGPHAPPVKRDMINRLLRLIDSKDDDILEAMCEKMDLDSIVEKLYSEAASNPQD